MIPLVAVSGTDHEMGAQLGTAFRDVLVRVTERTRQSLARHDGATVKRLQQEILDAARQVTPGCVAELEGMAEGAGVPFEALFATNAAYELGILADDGERCTSVGVPAQRSVDGRVLLGHNEDFSAEFAATSYLLHAVPNDGPSFVAFSYAGVLLHQGVNEAGIGQVGNALDSTDVRPGVPKLFAYREVMRAETWEEAFAAAVHSRRACGNNHILAADGVGVYGIEAAATRYAVLGDGATPVVHANHYVDGGMVDLQRPADLGNSRWRQRRLQARIDAIERHTTQTLREALSDHEGHPHGVCKHAPTRDGGSVTIGSVVIDVSEKRVHAACGHPCVAAFRDVGVGDDVSRAVIAP